MGLLGFIGDLLKKQPDIPEFKDVSPQDAQVQATRGNLSALSDIKQLAEEADKLSQDQLMKRLRGIVPDLDAITSGTSKNIADMTRGEIPESVSAAVSRNSAARSFAGGYGGSERAGFLRTRDLGLTSLDLTQKGLDNATRWLATARTTLSAPQFDVSSMFISPETQLKNTWMNTEARMNNQWMRAQQEAEGNIGTMFGNALQQSEAFMQQAAVSALGSFGGFAGGLGGGGKGLGAKGAASGAPGGYAIAYPPDGPPIYSSGGSGYPLYGEMGVDGKLYI